MDKFTEGPWRVSEKRGEYIDIRHSDESKGAMSLNLALVTSRLNWLEEAEANAHLMAAAPDMYKFIKVLADRGDVLAEELLAKARGESL